MVRGKHHQRSNNNSIQNYEPFGVQKDEYLLGANNRAETPSEELENTDRFKPQNLSHLPHTSVNSSIAIANSNIITSGSTNQLYFNQATNGTLNSASNQPLNINLYNSNNNFGTSHHQRNYSHSYFENNNKNGGSNKDPTSGNSVNVKI